jgi:hypothetical protein
MIKSDYTPLANSSLFEMRMLEACIFNAYR